MTRHNQSSSDHLLDSLLVLRRLHVLHKLSVCPEEQLTDGAAAAGRAATALYTHTHIGFFGLRGLSIGMMVFILYKLYVLLPYNNPTPKLSPYRKLSAFLLSQKT